MESSVVGIGCVLKKVSTNGISRIQISSVTPKGGAADSGVIKSGDILLAVNGIPVDSEELARELIVGIYGTSLDVDLERSGKQLKGTIWRGGTEAEAKAKNEADKIAAAEANSSRNIEPAACSDMLSVSAPVTLSTQPSAVAFHSDDTLSVPAAGTITISEIHMPEFASLVLRKGFVSVSPIFSDFVRKVLIKATEKTGDDWFQNYFVETLNNGKGEQDRVKKDGPNACWDIYLLCGKIFPRVIHSFVKEEDRLNLTELCQKVYMLAIATTRNTWGHIHIDRGLNPQAAVECFNSLKSLIQILQSHAQIHEFELNFIECRDHVDKFQQELLTHSVNSEIQIDVFELAVLFNMRACRHFVESMFFKHQLRAFISMVEEKKLFDFSCMLDWLRKQGKSLNQEEQLFRDVSYELARQGRNMVFHGSKNGPQQLLLLMSATLEISVCLMHQLKGAVFKLPDPSEDSSFSEPSEHEEEFKKDIKQRAAEIDGMIRLLLCRVNIQSFATLLHGASKEQQSSSLWEHELLDNDSAKIRRALFSEVPHQTSRCYFPKCCAVVVPEDLQLANLQEIDENVFKWSKMMDSSVALPVEKVFRKFKAVCPSKRDFAYDAEGADDMFRELKNVLKSCSVIRNKQHFDDASPIDLLQEQLPFIKEDGKVGLFKRCISHIPLNTGFNNRLSKPEIEKLQKVYKSRFNDAFKDFLTPPSDQWFEMSFSGFNGKFERSNAVGSAVAMLLAMSCHSSSIIETVIQSDAWKNGLGMVLQTQSGVFSAQLHDWCSPIGVKQSKYIEKVDMRIEFDEPEDDSLDEHVRFFLEVAQIGRNVIPKFTDALVKNAIHSRIDLVAWFRSNAAEPDNGSASPALFSSSGSSADLPPGWRCITENDRRYYVHLETFTISLEPPKPEFSPGLHRTLCDYLALERNSVNLFNLFKLQLWAMTPQKVDSGTQTETGNSDGNVRPSQTGGLDLSGAANQKAIRHQKSHLDGGSARS